MAKGRGSPTRVNLTRTLELLTEQITAIAHKKRAWQPNLAILFLTLLCFPAYNPARHLLTPGGERAAVCDHGLRRAITRLPDPSRHALRPRAPDRSDVLDEADRNRALYANVAPETKERRG